MQWLTTLATWALLLAPAVFAEDADQSPVEPLYFARWNINHGQYLIEVGRYLEALEAFQTAIEATDNPSIRADAYLNRAATLATYLDAFTDAIQEYRLVVRAYPETRQAEIGHYRLGLLLFEQRRYEEAVAQFEAHLQRYPQGRFVASVEALLRKSRQALELPSTPASPPPDRLAVRVRLLKGADRLVLGSAAKLDVVTQQGRTVYRSQGPVTLQAGLGDILVQQQSSHSRTLRITSTTPIKVAQKSVRCGGQQAASPGLYRGALQVSLKGGSLLVVNQVDVEAYLYGVVPAEAPSSWPQEALKAQAIAARTYALYQSQHRRKWQFDVVDNHGDQVYKGVPCEAETATRAVKATRGRVLVHQDRPILAMYTSNTGWHSAHAEHIFSQRLPYLVGVKDPYSPTQPMGHWRRTYKAVEVRNKLADLVRGRVDAIEDIHPEEVTPSGRIKKVLLVHADHNRVLRTRTTLKRALGLPDILMGITRQGDSLVFEGGGFGHGVGLSQWGAKAMAEQGKNVKDILQFYYRGAQLKQVW